ncbi:GAF domain-containing sensor histidine kinase [Luteimonas sp. RD2P54]|uniref:histidine kinase n=1 Tax=Luteimonas endophytica TaxID=3042023 RepID=A0ABT6JA51_9GAMM|nr:GAF domain-containing sensor histidine kinase [Luteimonas endophytica]MDH5823701.1 GAF domain-containing sensor histidine kinase [Luteimonas endophytica]
MNISTRADIALIDRIPAVEKILAMVSRLTGMRFAAVARVTDSRWIACAVRDGIGFGIERGGELPLETTICNEIRQHREPVAFGHASGHPHFRDHPTPKLYGFESYISVPIFRRDGAFFGTLCAIDPEPARLDDPAIVQTLELFAELIATHMDSLEQHELTSDALRSERDTARVREEFIAVLGHDLRNPLQVLSSNTWLLRGELDETWEQPLEDMRNACARMSELIDNILDFAHGRLGGGIPVVLRETPDLGGVLEDVVAEVRAAHPGRPIEADLVIGGPVRCDPDRVAQLFANLLINAAVHGEPRAPARATARADGDELVLSVGNTGRAIPEAQRRRLFEPFSRGEAGGHGQGLGLGLYIAAQIARAHRGTLEVESNDSSGTRFRFRMPLHD